MSSDLLILVVILFLIVCFDKKQGRELFTKNKKKVVKKKNKQCNLYGYVDFNDRKYQPAEYDTSGDIALNRQLVINKDEIYNDMSCSECSYEHDNKWKCKKCGTDEFKAGAVSRKESEFKKRYNQAMYDMDKIVRDLNTGRINIYVYHRAVNRWVRLYKDITLLPDDKVKQFIF